MSECQCLPVPYRAVFFWLCSDILRMRSTSNHQVTQLCHKQHTNADALSRGGCKQCGWEVEEEQEDNTSDCNAVSHLLLPTWTEEEIKSLQKADPDIHQMVHWLRTDTTPRGCPKDSSWRLQSLWVQ